MLILGLITVLTARTGMQAIIKKAVSASTNEINLLTKEAEIEKNILKIDGSVQALVGAV